MKLVFRFVIGLCAFAALLEADVSNTAAENQRTGTTFNTLKLGGGGWIVGIDISNDGTTKLARTDTSGAYVWDAATSTWSQTNKQSSMPPENFGYAGLGQVNQGGGGVYEICSAPNAPTIIYMAYNGHVFKSTDRAATWRRTNFAPVSMSLGSYRMNGRKMAVDPANANIVYVGTDRNGVFVTNDAGNSWSSISGIPTATSDGRANYPGYNIAFDPSSGTANGKTSTIYVFAYNGNGTGAVYVSTNAGATWTATTGGPTSVEHMIVAPSGGTVWATDGNPNIGGDLWKYSSGIWTKIPAAGRSLHSIAVNPANVSNIVVASVGGYPSISNDGGAHWNAIRTMARSATDVPWLAWTNENYMSNGDMMFDPADTNGLWFGEGIGVWYTKVPNTETTVTWYSRTAGIEQMVGLDVIAPNGIPITAMEDRPIFSLSTDPSVYPSSGNPNNAFALDNGWGLDYASSETNFIVAVINAGNNNNGGYSSDGGHTWYPFNSWYANVRASALENDGNGLVEITVPSTSGLRTWSDGTGTILRGLAINGAPNTIKRYWYATIIDSTHIKLQGSSYSPAISVTGDYIVYVDSNPISDFAGKYAVQGTGSDGGLIRLTVLNTEGGLQNNLPVCVSGVGGTTEANGCWLTINVNNKTQEFDLAGSTYLNAWTGGGNVTKILPPGGYIAASTPHNIVMVASNKDFPYCTTDGGKTWTRILAPGAPTTGDTGWSWAYYLNRHTAAADRVTPNTFYLYNYLKGTYKMINCDTPTLVSSSVFPNSSYNATLKSVPGNAGHLFFTAGHQGSAGGKHPAPTKFYRSTDGGQTWASVADMKEVLRFGFGKEAPGQSYPAIYVAGWYKSVYGIYHSIDNANTWTLITQYPLGINTPISALDGDLTTYGKFYFGLSGNGFGYAE